MPNKVTTRVPPQRIRTANRAAVNPDGQFVLYWMTAARRSEWNFGLQRAVQWAHASFSYDAYMSSKNTARKVRVDGYLRKYS